MCCSCWKDDDPENCVMEQNFDDDEDRNNEPISYDELMKTYFRSKGQPVYA
jgi:hypothetical protein